MTTFPHAVDGMEAAGVPRRQGAPPRNDKLLQLALLTEKMLALSRLREKNRSLTLVVRLRTTPLIPVGEGIAIKEFR